MEDLMDSSVLDARNSMEQDQETSTLMAIKSKPTEWTNEKHCLFLKSMETTFVNQLYKSIDLSGRHSNKNCPTSSKSSKHKLTSIRASSSQFKVFRDGCWSKMDFNGDEPKVDEQEESKIPPMNPWIQHYRSSKIQLARKLSASSKAPLAATENQNYSRNFQLWHQDSVGSNTEGTDQNFNDEAPEEDKSRKLHDLRRTRTTDTVSSNDQVVPFGNIDQVDNVIEEVPKD